MAPLLKGIDQIFIVPEGVLHLVSLDALPDDEGRYFVENGPIFHYLSAERELAEVRYKSKHGEGLLAMGNPAFGEGRPAAPSRKSTGADSLDAQYESLYFTALPASAREVERIASSWNTHFASRKEEKAAAVLFTDKAATEAHFKAEAPGKRVVHLATHGFFLNPGSAAGSENTRDVNLLGIAPYEDPDVMSPLGQNPLLCSGLALAQANRRQGSGSNGEDGILTAEEIAGLDLAGVDWIVLSGCDTGLGSILAGEGMFGLQRAFKLTGTKTVVMSLWPVEDKSAGLWMEVFYKKKIEENQSIAASVRAAGLTVLKQRRAEGRSAHPFYWAPFVATGDWR
jgi:CHAT domain-containing protein